MSQVSNDDIRYEQIQFLGKGAYSEVFKVNVQGNYYALKKIYPFLLNNPKVKNNVLRQAEIMSKVNHPNIIKLYQCILRQNQINFLLQYASNGTLYDQLKQYGRLPELKVKKYIKDVIKAVTYLHKQNIPIIHRDIKPENLLLDGNGVCKLADFGSSNFLDSERNSYVGTQEYMAPEMRQNLPHDQTLDIWCIGVLIYELLIGQTPNIQQFHLPNYISRTAQDVIKKILVHDPTCRITLKQLNQHIWLLDEGQNQSIQVESNNNLKMKQNLSVDSNKGNLKSIKLKNTQLDTKFKMKLQIKNNTNKMQQNELQIDNINIKSTKYMKLLDDQMNINFKIQLNNKKIQKYKNNIQTRRSLLQQQLNYMNIKIEQYNRNIQILQKNSLKPVSNRIRIVKILKQKINQLYKYLQNTQNRLYQKLKLNQFDQNILSIEQLPISQYIPKLKLYFMRDQRDALIELKTIIQRLQHMNELIMMENSINIQR